MKPISGHDGMANLCKPITAYDLQVRYNNIYCHVSSAVGALALACQVILMCRILHHIIYCHVAIAGREMLALACHVILALQDSPPPYILLWAHCSGGDVDMPVMYCWLGFNTTFYIVMLHMLFMVSMDTAADESVGKGGTIVLTGRSICSH